jgi:hydroxypyruvate isomerase
MPRFAANLTLLFPDLPFLDRFEAARAAGFEGVEIQFPYDHPAPAILARLDRTRLPLVVMNAPPPNYTGGARGFAAVPGAEDRFRHDFRRAARVAATFGALHLHVMAGVARGAAARETFLRNLAWAAAAAPALSLTIEPLNPGDLPGYFLADFDTALAVLDAVGAPNLGLQFDAYHAQAIAGDALAVWDAVAPRVRHVQVAGHPGRHEPDPDALAALLTRLDAAGYAGWVGAEYHPRATTTEGLGWLAAARARAVSPPA